MYQIDRENQVSLWKSYLPSSLLELIKPSNCITYGISDIPGDDPSFIGSGPTIYTNNDTNKFFEILDNYKIKIFSNK